jgi:hypothetical protein
MTSKAINVEILNFSIDINIGFLLYISLAQLPESQIPSTS